MLRSVLSDLPLRLPWEDLTRDIHYITQALQRASARTAVGGATFQIANELFYRNKAAWLVGVGVWPTAFIRSCCLSTTASRGALFIDACLTGKAEASIVFGFARSYFMVYAPLPAAMVEWLQRDPAGKTTAELYMAIGCQKHGKTECYREYLTLWAQSQEQFIIAPG